MRLEAAAAGLRRRFWGLPMCEGAPHPLHNATLAVLVSSNTASFVGVQVWGAIWRMRITLRVSRTIKSFPGLPFVADFVQDFDLKDVTIT